MICVQQNSWNCWVACVASLLNSPLVEMPPHDFDMPGQEETFLRYLLTRNIIIRSSTIEGFIPYGYTIIGTRTTDGFMHAMVCLNGKPIWCPNGHELPEEWNGLIEGRLWQTCDPFIWFTFCAMDPSLPMGQYIDMSIPGIAEVMANAQRLYDAMKPLSIHQRSGAVTFNQFLCYADSLADFYTNAETEEQGRAALLSALDDIQAGRTYKFKERRPRVIASVCCDTLQTQEASPCSPAPIQPAT